MIQLNEKEEEGVNVKRGKTECEIFIPVPAYDIIFPVR